MKSVLLKILLYVWGGWRELCIIKQ